jgi:hypothetical protein
MFSAQHAHEQTTRARAKNAKLQNAERSERLHAEAINMLALRRNFRFRNLSKVKGSERK